MSINTPMRNLERAIQVVGSGCRLAAELNVAPSLIFMWRKRGRVPAEYCPGIERATRGFVRCEDLRPDVPWSVLREAA